MLNILQLTDLHLCTSPPKDRFDLDTNSCLESVLQHTSIATPQADLMLLTGDLVHDDPLAYQQLISIFKGVQIPTLHLSGNHDFHKERCETLAHFPFLTQKVWRNQYWQIIMLNSAIAGKVEGEITAEELNFVQQQLATYPKLHTLIAMHHHPMPIGSQWMDRIGVQNGQEFMASMSGYENVKAIIFGHIHQVFESQVKHIKILGTPSTNRQFKSRTDDYELDDKSPAYRTIQLHDDGEVSSQVIWLS